MVGHISRDATAIEAREKPVKTAAPEASTSVSGCENPRKDSEELDRWAKNRRCSGWLRVI
jgi:hypothetical protein